MPMTVHNTFNVLAKMFEPLEKLAFPLFCVLKDRKSDINRLLHRTAFSAMANRPTGPKIMHCTILTSKRLFPSIQALAETFKEVTIPLVNYAVPNPHRACFSSLMGSADVPRIAANFNVMDNGAYYLLGRCPRRSRSIPSHS